MKTKTLFIAVALLVAVLLSACGSAVMPVSSNSQSNPRVLTVSGIGKVMLKPDIAFINIGVRTEKPGAAEAVAENNTNTQKLIDALKAAGVDANDIQTSNFSIWQNTQYGPDGKPTTSNYAVDNTVYLTVRKLEQLGDLLDAAVRAGANNVNSIQFDLADKTKALSDARAEAVKTANSQANELAAAAGVGLGKIQSIQYFDATPSPVYQGKGMGGGGAIAADVAVPINPGQMEITVTVTMAYEIK
ncbi:MAG TPA: SIMPL domain-containing protein [Anaerolineales bacterium]